MTEIRYCGLTTAPTRLTVTGMGAGASDGWQIVHVLPQTSMPNGARQYAIAVQGQFSNRQVNGAGILRGMFQVCLGRTDGTRYLHYRASHTIGLPLGADDGIPFQFLVLISSGLPDVGIGGSFDPAAGELCLWARSTWNGDAQTYQAGFDVEGLSWLWWVLSSIPSGHATWGRYLPASPVALPSVPGLAVVTSSAFGDDDQTWLCFQNVWYEPRGYNQPAPQFAMGQAADGTLGTFLARIGSTGWGMSRVPPFVAVDSLAEVGQIQQGGFWTIPTSGTATRMIIGAWAPAPGVVWIRRAHWFAVRIDTLADMRRASFATTPLGGPMTGDAWRTTSLTLERPAVGTLVEPIVMAHGVARLPVGAFGGMGVRVLEQQDGSWFGATAAPQIEPARGEGASAMAFGRRVFQVSSPAIQWRLAQAGSAGSPPSPQPMADGELVAFHPVRDPENVTTPPGSLAAPIVVVPDRQAPDVGSLADPPHRPAAARPQRGRNGRPAIRGSTGYRRSWPLGMAPVAELSLQWGPMPRAEAQAVFDFLRAHVAGWRYTPPTGAAQAAANLSNPELVAVDHRNATVTVDVAILTFTGP